MATIPPITPPTMPPILGPLPPFFSGMPGARMQLEVAHCEQSLGALYTQTSFSAQLFGHESSVLESHLTH